MAIRIDGDNATATPGITGGDADTGLVFGTDEVKIVTGGTDRVTVGSTGNLSIAAGNLVLASGSGIDFSATADGSGTVTSELLDDYEEGTWTPVVKSGTNTITYTGGNPNNTYTKVGNQVTVNLSLNGVTTSGTTGAGSFQIEGLPFVCGGGEGWRTIGTLANFWNTGLRATAWPVYSHISEGNSVMQIYHKANVTSQYVPTDVGNVGTNGYFHTQITYLVD